MNCIPNVFAVAAALAAAGSMLPCAAQGTASDAPAELSAADVTSQNGLSDPNAVEDSSDSVEEWAESFKEKFGIADWGENDGKFVLFRSQQAALKMTDPEFGRSLASAYDLAMMGIQEEMTLMRFGRLVQDKVREFYRDSSTHAKDIEVELPSMGDATADKLKQVFDKSLDVAGAKLDKELRELGVPQEEIATMAPTKKKAVFSDHFLKNTMKVASGEIGGIFPVQTTVKYDKKGNATVGVVALCSDKTIQVAKDISLQRASLVTGKGRDLSAMKPAQDALLGTLGVRLVYDVDGTPAIVSYALGAYVPDGDDDYVNAELRRDAKSAAQDAADGQIAEVVNGFMSVRNDRTTGQEIDKIVEREMKPDALSQERVVKNMLDKTRQFAQARASMRLQGVSTMNAKLFTLPTGQKMWSVMRVWKYSTLKAVTKFNETSRRAASGKPVAVGPAGTAAQGGSDSAIVNSLEDF